MRTRFDAGARRIEIDIERAGSQLIRVRDDGCGLDARGSAARARAPRYQQDRDARGPRAASLSFGFRGEALPSIGSVARLRMLSRRADASQALRADVSMAAFARRSIPAAHPPGTSVEVRDLFYNVPARRKFVRSRRAPSSATFCARSSASRCRCRAWRCGCATTGASCSICPRPPIGRGDRAAHRSHSRAPSFAPLRCRSTQRIGPLRAARLARTAHRGARAARFAVLVRQRAARCATGCSLNAVRLGFPRRALPRPASELPAVSDARSARGRRQCAPEQARAALSRQPRGARWRVSRRRARARRHATRRRRTRRRPRESARSRRTWSASHAIDFGDRVAAAPALLEPAREAIYARSSFAAVQALAAAAPATQPQPLGVPIAQLHGLYILAQNREGLIVGRYACGPRARALRAAQGAVRGGGARPRSCCSSRCAMAAAEHEIEALLAERADLERLGFELERIAPERLAVRRVPVLLAHSDIADLLEQLARELAGDDSERPSSGWCGAPHPRQHRLPRRHSWPAHAQPGGDGCAVAADGADRARQPVQSRAADLDATCRCARSISCFCGDADGRGAVARQPRTLPLLVLTGPTGSGKSALRAGSWPSGLRRGAAWRSSASTRRRSTAAWTSAPPSRARQLRAQLPHHLIDIRDPAESYLGGEFVRDARAAIAAIHARGALPLLVGGTHAVSARAARRTGAAAAASPAAAQRDRCRRRRRAAGRRCTRSSRASIREAAARIAPQDAQRIQRALEVYRLTGVPHLALAARDARLRPRALSLAALCAAARVRATHAACSACSALRTRCCEAGLVDEVRRCMRAAI